MFLCQKFGYNHKLLSSHEQMDEVWELFNANVPKFMVFDTETTGLHIIQHTPFLMTFGWDKNVFAIDLLNDVGRELAERVYQMMRLTKRTFAHNAKYDYHMMINYGLPITEDIPIACSQTVARLTNYSDETFDKDLETMGTLYVDPTAKMGKKIIETKLQELKKVRKNKVKSEYAKIHTQKPLFGKLWEEYDKRVAFVPHEFDEWFTWIDSLYSEPNYLDVYENYPNLMILYAIDDCVIMLEWLRKALPILPTVDANLKTFKRECELIRVVASMERVGFKADIEYLLTSRVVSVAYQKKLYTELHALLGVQKLTVGQHDYIKRLFSEKFRIPLKKADNKALRKITDDPIASRISWLIRRLRTVDKWISTYIDGTLNKVYDGRIYAGIDNAGTVSGRVSSNLQQLPKEALFDDDNNELFHPRKVYLVDDGYKMYYFDYSQQELRVQAYYTILVSGGDKSLCRAYMPFKCVSLLTDEVFDYKNPAVLKRWNSGEWVLEEDPTQLWTPLDVHCVTTHTAFPEIPYVSLSFNDLNPPLFKTKRKQGKVCNFLKNYQGGKDAIMEQLDVDEDIADLLDKAYYKAFPDIKKFQRWVTNEMHKFGFMQNLYGRRYYMRNSQWFYRIGNYLVQGSSADMVKIVQLKVHTLLQGTKSNLVMSVHDEILVRVHPDDEYLVPVIKAIMEDVPEVPYVPMVSEVEWSNTNWANKRKA